jgi:hypothetical protein
LRNLSTYKRLWLLLCAPAALLLTFLAAAHPGFAEWYATVIYPPFSLGINTLTSLVPFSLAELLLVLLIFGIIYTIIRYILKFMRDTENRRENLFKWIINLLCAASVLYFIFTITCGINYSRYPFAQTSGLEVRASSKAELTELCNELADKINALRKNVQIDKNGVMRLSDSSLHHTAKQAQTAYNKINADYPLLRPGYGQPKLVFGSRLMSYCNITGIFVPFTFEANVNTDVPNFSIPFTMCHELSHLRGYMREDETNFIGYLVCEKSDDPDFRYSGNMLAFIHVSNALYGTDPAAANKVFGKLSEGVRRDLQNNSAYWAKFEGPVADTANTVNDQYLKANRQEDGIKSYGRMVDLLLSEYRAKKGTR